MHFMFLVMTVLVSDFTCTDYKLDLSCMTWMTVLYIITMYVLIYTVYCIYSPAEWMEVPFMLGMGFREDYKTIFCFFLSFNSNQN